jgi:membrane-associated phospholipid phosphatase
LKRKHLITGLLLLFALHASSQDSLFRYPKLSLSYGVSYFHDGWKTFRSPLTWRGRQWLTFGAASATGLIIYTQDEGIRNFILENKTPFTDKLSKYGFEPVGSGLYSLSMLGGMYFFGRLTKNSRLSATMLTAGKAACISSVFAVISKQLAHRHRPFQDPYPDHRKWDGPFSNMEYTSFPSGHSTLAFSIATVLASEYADAKWVPVLAYSIAAGTALSRINDERHWASDIFAGSLLGYFTGRMIWKLNSRVMIIPEFSSRSSSMRLIIPIQSQQYSIKTYIKG